MKLSKLYSNYPDKFGPIEFVDGLNVILAEIKLPEKKTRDTHNLGKTTLGRLLDFVFLSSRDNTFFLFKHSDLFEEFVFFFEIELQNGSFVTLRRSVLEASKISFKKHEMGRQDFSDIPVPEWDHHDIPLDRARELLDALLDLSALRPWHYRKGLGYLLRSQDDYHDVFQLQRFAPGRHADWKPFLAHVLGFDAGLISELYANEEQLATARQTEETIKSELGGSLEDISKIEGILLLKQNDAEKKQRLLDAFDFRTQDKVQTKQLVDEIDDKIALLNEERYSKSFSKKKILTSLQDDHVLFSTDQARQLFQEAGIVFEGQILVDFEQLVAFNRAVSQERRAYLEEELEVINARLKEVNSELTRLGRTRSEMLRFLSSTDVFAKYKALSNDLVSLRADITSLERQREHLHRLQDLRTEIRSLIELRGHLQTRIEHDVEQQNSASDSRFSAIRVFFSEIVEEVINRQALLSAVTNQYGHIYFKAEILDESGNATSADLGHTYKKLLCVAFDLAVLRAHLDHRFPRFAYHDGVFESLDNRKKENLITVIREYMSLGLQLVITAIDSDLPPAQHEIFTEDETVVLLHDRDHTGRLFRMDSW